MLTNKGQHKSSNSLLTMIKPQTIISIIEIIQSKQHQTTDYHHTREIEREVKVVYILVEIIGKENNHAPRFLPLIENAISVQEEASNTKTSIRKLEQMVKCNGRKL